MDNDVLFQPFTRQFSDRAMQDGVRLERAWRQRRERHNPGWPPNPEMDLPLTVAERVHLKALEAALDEAETLAIEIDEKRREIAKAYAAYLKAREIVVYATAQLGMPGEAPCSPPKAEEA